MKKLLLLWLLLFCLVPSVVLANSGPVVWETHPSTGLLPLPGDSGVRVEEELLELDFRSFDGLEYALQGEARAIYRMVHEEPGSQTVDMAFPLVGSLEDLSAFPPVILVDGEKVPVQVLPGAPAGDDGDFAAVLDGVNRLSGGLMDPATPVTLHTFQVEVTRGEEVNFGVDFTLDPQRTRGVSRNFNGFSWDESGRIQLTSWIRGTGEVDIAVLGESPDFVTSAWTDGQQSDPTDGYRVQRSERQTTLRELLLSGWPEDPSAGAMEVLADDQLWALRASRLQEAFAGGNPVASDHDLMDLSWQQRYYVLAFQVPFEENVSRTVEVQYRISGSMDRSTTRDPVYTVRYLLNPAAGWREFGKLEVRIFTPEMAPYVIASSQELVPVEPGLYEGSFEGLPEGDLELSLYTREEITAGDRIRGTLASPGVMYPLLLFGPPAALLLLVLLVLWGRRRKKRLNP